MNRTGIIIVAAALLLVALLASGGRGGARGVSICLGFSAGAERHASPCCGHDAHAGRAVDHDDARRGASGNRRTERHDDPPVEARDRCRGALPHLHLGRHDGCCCTDLHLDATLQPYMASDGGGSSRVPPLTVASLPPGGDPAVSVASRRLAAPWEPPDPGGGDIGRLRCVRLLL